MTKIPTPVPERNLAALQEVLTKEKVDNVAIIIFNSPDPDALASAFALAFLLKQLDVKSKIYTEKEISHPNNQMMVNTLDIPLLSLKDMPDKVHFYAIVDFQYREPPNPDMRCIIHFDHHKETTSHGLYQHIDVTAGSCATIVCEYLKALELKDTKQLSKISLGLAYGIYTDTTSFYQANPKDFEALSFLKPYYDSDQFQHLVNVKWSTQTMEVIKKALEHNQVRGTFAYSGIGHISGEYRDSLAIAADFLLNQTGIQNVLVFAVVEDEAGNYINGCFRTNDSAIDVHKFMQSFIVHGTGGGRKTAGGFQEPLGFFAEIKSKEKLWDVVRSAVEDKIKPKISLTKVENNETKS